MFSNVLMALTAPVTLACTIDDGGRQVAMTLWLDEPNGAVRYAMPTTATAVTSRALFMRERVMFDRYTLDRASLEIVRDGDAVTAVLGAQPVAARGRCRIDGPHRKSVPPAKAGVSQRRRGT